MYKKKEKKLSQGNRKLFVFCENSSGCQLTFIVAAIDDVVVNVVHCPRKTLSCLKNFFFCPSVCLAGRPSVCRLLMSLLLLLAVIFSLAFFRFSCPTTTAAAAVAAAAAAVDCKCRRSHVSLLIVAIVHFQFLFFVQNEKCCRTSTTTTRRAALSLSVFQVTRSTTRWQKRSYEVQVRLWVVP